MTEASNSVDRPVEWPRAQAQAHARGYERAREAKMHAAMEQSGESAQTRSAIERLSRLLSAGAPLREDVPRGYYLNIRV